MNLGPSLSHHINPTPCKAMYIQLINFLKETTLISGFLRIHLGYMIKSLQLQLMLLLVSPRAKRRHRLQISHYLCFSQSVNEFVCFCFQSTIPGFIGNMMKGLKGEKADSSLNYIEAREALIGHLDSIFSRFPFSEPDNAYDVGDLDLHIGESLTMSALTWVWYSLY